MPTFTVCQYCGATFRTQPHRLTRGWGRYCCREHADLGRAAERGDPLRPAAGPADLTPRQRDIAGLIAAGLANKEIAAKLTISELTVKNMLTTIYLRAGVQDRVGLARWVWERQRAAEDRARLGRQIEVVAKRLHALEPIFARGKRYCHVKAAVEIVTRTLQERTN